MKPERRIDVRWRNLLHALEHLYATLRLPGFRGFIAKAINIALHMFDLLLLPNVHRLLLGKLLGAQGFKLAVVAGEQVDGFVFDVSDTCTDFIEKIPIV